MRWPNKKIPQVGDTKEVISFCFKPHKCDDGHTYWLEKIKTTYIWTRRALPVNGYKGAYEFWGFVSSMPVKQQNN